MEDEILVSISCVTYNHEEYIEKCLASLVMQETTFKYEILVHDDCSTDKTQEVVRKFEKKHPELIKPIYQTENQWSKGLSVTFTYQYPRAKGKYIAICEGDDYWIDPLKLQKQVDFMESHPDFIMCGTNGLTLYDDRSFPPRYFNNCLQSREFVASDIIGKWAFPTASFLIRKELIDKVSEFQISTIHGDLKMILMSLLCGRIFYFSDLMVVYRKNYKESSASSMVDKRIDAGLNSAIQKKMLYCAYNNFSNGIYSSYIDDYLNLLNAIILIQQDKKKYSMFAYLFHPFKFYRYVYPDWKKRKQNNRFILCYRNLLN